jgi:hypothetical protein
LIDVLPFWTFLKRSLTWCRAGDPKSCAQWRHPASSERVALAGVQMLAFKMKATCSSV